ncbi:glycine betaine ABC transporter substrate-binding protein [Parafrankia sp. EUN1f]|uniref:glycine betaine ABC transporter substrate-binding protein n=1 Tax=Parafrankia sp. EUN1f TaxID=102897 RepID=UPI0001C43A9A|nr:glycine betaine ABC transporter substrate-binding protein [Parafrankia sp. EUN1f]EFC83557.1 Substrate-binding region of ABC-type glycine betaine transport system [Parafrankia sp. EUN1f]
MRLPEGRARRGAAIGAVLCVVLVGALVGARLAGVGTGDDSGEGASSRPQLVVGSTGAIDDALVADLYARELNDHGHNAVVRSFASRDQLMWALEQGTVDLAPTYLDELRDGLAEQAGSGVQATPALSSNVAEVTGLMQALTQRRLIAYPTAPGGRTPAFAVTAATAEQAHLSTLSDLAAPGVATGLTLGAPAACQTWAGCLPALRDSYGVGFGQAKELDDGGPGTIRALLDGTVQVALVYGSDPAVAANKLVLLQDDRHLLPANNLLPLVRMDVANLELQGLLYQVTQTITTANLLELQQQVSAAPDGRARAIESYLDKHVQTG